MKISQMSPVLALAQASNDCIHMVGDHGIGKSKIVEDFAKEQGVHLEILMLSQQETADLIGIPDMIDGVTYWSKPVWLKRMEDAQAAGKRCLLFLDELARAPLEVRQAALQLVLDRKIHEHHLPERDGIKTLVVAADNPAEKYQTDELDAALLDRFMTFTVETDVPGWLRWARANNINPVITDFVAEYPGRLHFTPEDDKDKGATPRAWAKLSDIIQNLKMVDESLVFSMFVSKVGDTVGQSFYHWFNNYVNVVKVEDIVKVIKKLPIKSQTDQEVASIELSKITKDIEAISADELAQKIRVEIENKDLDINILSVYIGSLNVEIGNSIAKAWKNSEEDSSFFFKWASAVPNKYLFTRVVGTYEK